MEVVYILYVLPPFLVSAFLSRKAYTAIEPRNALTRNGGSLYCIYSLHFSLVHSWALNGSDIYAIYAPSLPFEVRCENGIYIYIYLGSNIIHNGEIFSEVGARLGKAARAFRCLWSAIFDNKSLSVEIKRGVYHAVQNCCMDLRHGWWRALAWNIWSAFITSVFR